MLTTKSIFCKTILFISLSIISAGCASSEAKKLAEMERKFKSSVNNSRWKETIVLADELLQYKPNDPEVNLEKGSALSQLGRPIEALIFLNKSIEYSTSKHWFLGFTYFIKGNCLKALKRYEEALASYRLAVKHGYDDRAVYHYGYEVLFKLGRLKEGF